MSVKPRFYLLVSVVILFFIIVVAASASSGGSRNGQPAGVCTATINGAVGLSQVEISNQNTGKTIIRTAAELPYTFNLNKGDTLEFNVTIIDGYQWNAWEIDRAPWFAQDNPLIIKVDGAIVFDANCIVK